MSETAKLVVGDRTFTLPVVTGSEEERAVDVSQLRADSGLITLDEGYGNTGSCESAITFIDGERGVLRYRGYPIEQLAEHSDFVETSYLLMFGELPNAEQLSEFRALLNRYMFIHENMRHHFSGFPADAPPMAILSAMVNTLGCFQGQVVEPSDTTSFEDAAARLMSKVRTVAAWTYRTSRGLATNYPRHDMSYTANFLHMMFCMPNAPCEPSDEVVRALDVILLLHADHEQNCSTSTVRMVGSSHANLYASIAAGVCALWGPLHGGANLAVIRMLERIQQSGQPLQAFVDRVKDKSSGERLMGFGHRVYKNFDPRAKIIKQACDSVLENLGVHDPLLDIAKQLEEVALRDEYFVERKLYPNVDFNSGIIMKAIGIPVDMFPVIFAMGRLPGWMANWREVWMNPNGRIYRPRQVYQGPNERDYIPLPKRSG